MAKIDIPRLVIKSAGRRQRCYWNPSATLIKAGWKMQPLGTDIDAAIAKAKKLNAEVEAWRDGGARPRAIKNYVKRGSMRQLIAHFKEIRFPRLEKSTQKTYGWALQAVEKWAGDEFVEHITRARVRKLRDALLKPNKKGIVQLDRANGIMRVLRTLMKFAIGEGFLPEGTKNPAEEQDVPAARPRDQTWSQPAIDAFIAETMAEPADAQPSLELAILLGREVTQREADIISLTERHWVIIPPYRLDHDDWARLSDLEPDGQRTVRGIRVRQHKTKRWVEVPVVGRLRQLIVEAIASARADNSMLLLREMAIPANARNRLQWERQVKADLASAGVVDDSAIARALAAGRLPRPWNETRFQRAIALFRERAVDKALEAGDEDLAEEIAGLQFRDMRRTGVVWLGELGIEDHLIASITGHKLDETKKILETYMPRTTKMAGRAVALRVERSGHDGQEIPAKGKKLS